MIVIDTNAIIYAIQNKIRFENFVEEEIVVPTSVVSELESLANSNNDARIALRVSSRMKKIPVRSTGDQGVEEAAIKTNSKVITNDLDLRLKLSRTGIITWTIGRNGVKK